MRKINNFENFNTYEKSINIINSFDSFLRKKEFQIFINNLTIITKLEKQEIIFFFRKIFLNNFDYNNNNINRKISYVSIIKYFFIFNGLIFSKIFLKKKLCIPRRIKFLINNIDYNDQLYFYKKIINHFGKKKTLIFKDVNFKCNYSSIKFNLIFNSIIPFKIILKFLKLSFLI